MVKLFCFMLFLIFPSLLFAQPMPREFVMYPNSYNGMNIILEKETGLSFYLNKDSNGTLFWQVIPYKYGFNNGSNAYELIPSTSMNIAMTTNK